MDYNVKDRVKADRPGVNLANVKTSRKEGLATEVVVVSIGVKQAQKTLRAALAMGALRVGDPQDATTQMGPVVSQGQLAGNLDYVRLAGDEGCKVTGGQQLKRPGSFQSPALCVGATNQMRVSREQIFGPCASVIKVGGFDAASAMANDTPSGLSSGICTGSLKHATAFRRGSEAGMVMVNLAAAGVDYHVPFGGRGASCLGGREQGRWRWISIPRSRPPVSLRGGGHAGRGHPRGSAPVAAAEPSADRPSGSARCRGAVCFRQPLAGRCR